MAVARHDGHISGEDLSLSEQFCSGKRTNRIRGLCDKIKQLNVEIDHMSLGERFLFCCTLSSRHNTKK